MGRLGLTLSLLSLSSPGQDCLHNNHAQRVGVLDCSLFPSPLSPPPEWDDQMSLMQHNVELANVMIIPEVPHPNTHNRLRNGWFLERVCDGDRDEPHWYRWIRCLFGADFMWYRSDDGTWMVGQTS